MPSLCKTQIPCPCSRSQPGVEGQFKGPLRAFVTYCTISYWLFFFLVLAPEKQVGFYIFSSTSAQIHICLFFVCVLCSVSRLCLNHSYIILIIHYRKYTFDQSAFIDICLITVLAVEPFQDKYISETVLKKLIKQNIVVELKPDSEKDKYIYKDGHACDYFILILQGRYSALPMSVTQISQSTLLYQRIYSRRSLSRLRLSRITAYLE